MLSKGIRYVTGAFKKAKVTDFKRINGFNFNPASISRKTGVRFTSENGFIENERGKIIGKIHYSIQDNYLSKNSLPDSWFNENNGLKKYLWLEHISINDEQRGKGYGTKAMQELFSIALSKGCGGRMLCYSAWGSHGYYAAEGWEILAQKAAIERAENKIAKKTELIKSSKNPEEIASLQDSLNYLRALLKKLKIGLPFKDEFIMFNPSNYSITKLFNKKSGR